MKDEFVSVEHLLLALADAQGRRGGRVFRSAGLTYDKVLKRRRPCGAASA